MSTNNRASRLMIAAFCFASALAMFSRFIFPQASVALFFLSGFFALVAAVLAVRVNRPGKRFYWLVVLLLIAPWLVLVIKRMM
jgi:hypothetical protein